MNLVHNANYGLMEADSQSIFPEENCENLFCIILIIKQLHTVMLHI